MRPSSGSQGLRKGGMFGGGGQSACSVGVLDFLLSHIYIALYTKWRNHQLFLIKMGGLMEIMSTYMPLRHTLITITNEIKHLRTTVRV